jgi:enoyl-CoA hydratase/carnithine racemase
MGDPAASYSAACGSDELECTRDGPVAVIRLDRPRTLNAITPTMEADLHSAIDAADADDSIRAIVLSATGTAFCSGYDFGEESDFETETDRLMHWWQIHVGSQDRHFHLMELGTPVIAAVRGWCLGGGFWYALSADITLAGEDAVFGQPEVRELENSSILLALLAGWKNAYRYSLTGDHFDAAEALRIGIVNEVVPSDEVEVRAVALGQRIARVPATSVRLNKALTSTGLEAMGLRTALRSAALVSVIIHGAHDSEELAALREVRRTEGMRASLRRRDDQFRPEPGGPRSRPSERGE